MHKHEPSPFTSIVLVISFLLAGCTQTPAHDPSLIQDQTPRPASVEGVLLPNHINVA
jgi:hypothetical protein